MASLSPVVQNFINKALESNFALWSALLTVNGIMLTAFSILPVVSIAMNKLFSLPLVACCSVSIVLLVHNFTVTKEHYLKIGQMLCASESDLTNEQREQDIKTEKRKFHNVRLAEKAVLLLFLVEIMLLGVMLSLASP